MNSKNTLIKIYNGQIVTPSRILNNGTIIIRNGIIEAIAEGDLEVKGAIEIDA